MDKVIGVLLTLGVFVLVIAIGPIFTLWSINFLFHTEIPINFYSWCAVAWLTFIIRGGIKTQFSNSNTRS